LNLSGPEAPREADNQAGSTPTWHNGRSMAIAPAQVIGRYAIYEKIASGGMASVHFGRLLGAVGFSRTVAVKKLHAHLAEDPEFRSTMIDEARLAARIRHPHVVPTLDVVAAKGELLLVMDYVQGESLGRLMRVEADRRRRIPLPIVSAIGTGALLGLHAAHEARSAQGAALGIVHRDVSPQNILVGVDGLARVIDFGVAKAAVRVQTTREGVLKGKMAYMAPEQFEGGALSRRTDVYAMSVVLWELLTGRRLFQAAGEAALLGLVLAGARSKPSALAPGIPDELDKLVMTGLSMNPAKRFASARVMADELRKVVPPAFSTDVGAWVEEVAGQALATRGSRARRRSDRAKSSPVEWLHDRGGRRIGGPRLSCGRRHREP
jgi:serine/threonine protein kinase